MTKKELLKGIEIPVECGKASCVDAIFIMYQDMSKEQYGSKYTVYITENQKKNVAWMGTSDKKVGWKKLDKLRERDRAFLWSCGLLEVDDYFDLVLSWGDDAKLMEQIHN